VKVVLVLVRDCLAFPVCWAARRERLALKAFCHHTGTFAPEEVDPVLPNLESHMDRIAMRSERVRARLATIEKAKSLVRSGAAHAVLILIDRFKPGPHRHLTIVSAKTVSVNTENLVNLRIRETDRDQPDIERAVPVIVVADFRTQRELTLDALPWEALSRYEVSRLNTVCQVVQYRLRSPGNSAASSFLR
jgi:hypothetical protein